MTLGPYTNQSINQAEMIDHRASLLSIMRPICGASNYQVSELINILAPLRQHQIEAIQEIVIERATKRDRLAVKLLRNQFSGLKIRTNFDKALCQIEIVMCEILRRGLNEEGIFRLTKNLDQAESLTRSVLEEEEEMDLTLVGPYDLAVVVKSFTKIAFPQLIKITDLEIFKRSNDVQIFLDNLSTTRRNYLAKLSAMCRTIAANEYQNKMSMANLARVFAPNLFQHPSPLVEMQWISTTIGMVESILSKA